MSMHHVLAGLGLAAFLAASPACAQSTMPDRSGAIEALQQAQATRRIDAAPGAVSLVDLGEPAPGQRQRFALRMRFDAATRAMRSWGVEADGCNSLVRSHTRMQADQPGGSERLQVSVSFAVSCRFF